MKNEKRTILAVSAALLGTVLILAALLFFGVIHCNEPDRGTYPVAGVDLSSWQ